MTTIPGLHVAFVCITSVAVTLVSALLALVAPAFDRGHRRMPAVGPAYRS